ncbi:hypothetical protein HGRIS_001885 [Hohenbuehelia grisea]|uniref:Uncharacterized protein n=1 Tax=Hohenbuehelia grisea TaxID=104357 RepID=A0ABR3JK24_9AGAR
MTALSRRQLLSADNGLGAMPFDAPHILQPPPDPAHRLRQHFAATHQPTPSQWLLRDRGIHATNTVLGKAMESHKVRLTLLGCWASTSTSICNVGRDMVWCGMGDVHSFVFQVNRSNSLYIPWIHLFGHAVLGRLFCG